MRYSGGIVNRVLAVAATVFCVATAMPRIAAANDDAGPAGSVLAIRREVPKILANRMGGDGSVSVMRVVTDGTHAVAIWQGGGNVGFVVMRERNGLWWLQAYADHPPHRNEWTGLQSSPPSGAFCGSGANPTPAATDLVDRFAFPLALAQSAAAAYAESGAPSPLIIALKGGGTLIRPRYVDCVTYEFPGAMVDGYALDLHGQYSQESMPSMTARNATPESENKISDLVDLTISSSVSLENFKLDLWCPWLLNPASRYTLKLRLPDGSEQLVAGSLDNTNNLHFVLPPIPIVPLAVTHGTISVDPPATQR
jgi:hypothetical protein